MSGGGYSLHPRWHFVTASLEENSACLHNIEAMEGKGVVPSALNPFIEVLILLTRVELSQAEPLNKCFIGD